MAHRSERINLKIIIVGSTHAQPDSLTSLFVAKDITVLTLEDSLDVLSRIERELPHLVICRACTLENRFLDLCRHLEAKRKTADIPILLVAEQFSQADIATALSAGVEDLLSQESLEVIEIKAMRLALSTRESRQRDEIEVGEREIIKFLPAIVYVAKPVPPYSPIYVSQNIESLGYKIEEWYSRDDLWVSLVHPDDSDRVLKATEEALSNGIASEYEYRMIARDGSVVWVHDRGTFVRDDEGQPLYWQGVILDVTDRKRAEAREAQEKSRFQQLFENSPAAIALLDDDRKVVRTNRAFQELFQFNCEDIKGRAISDLIVPDERADESLSLHRCTRQVIETVRKRRDGELIPVHVIGIPVEIEGHGSARFAMYLDLTERKLLEDQLIQSEKLAALGELVSSIAHELNSPLTSVIGYATLLLADENLCVGVREYAQVIQREGERARKIIQNLLSFARKHERSEALINLNEMVERTLELRAYELQSQSIAVATELGDVPPLSADWNLLQQVVLNLIINAEQALTNGRRGGRITIRTRHELSEGCEWVSIIIGDDGPGIRPEYLPKVFQPFFTTKEQGKGTGLGLSISHKIVTDHGGKMWAESEVDHGATFIIKLPLLIGRTPVVSGLADSHLQTSLEPAR
ncbi:MAG: PAS domain S-box protein [Blastocatellia bacterium]